MDAASFRSIYSIIPMGFSVLEMDLKSLKFRKVTAAVCIVESSNRESSSRDMLSNNVDLYRVDLILLHKYDAI